MGVAFPSACRQWRQRRKISQLELSLRANVSQRHISYLESGRSQPSRDMVIRLCDALDVPLRERNALLESAGFAGRYQESRLDEQHMAPIRHALQSMLQHHQPYPAVVIDREWNIVMLNEVATAWFGWITEAGNLTDHFSEKERQNLALMTVHPQGFRQFISNWPAVAPKLLQRIQAELPRCNAQQTLRMKAIMDMISEPEEAGDSAEDALLPVLPVDLAIAGQHMSLFSVISTFGTPQDITTDDLKVEFFYPADAHTMTVFERMAQPGGR